MLEAVRKNFGLKVLALAIAILAWAYLRFAGNPTIAAHLDQPLLGSHPSPAASATPQAP